MNDKELADKVVALGVGYSDHDSGISEYDAPIPGDTPLTADEFVRDWSVAGVILFEAESQLTPEKLYTIVTELILRAELSDPRAIIEDCVEALNE